MSKVKYISVEEAALAWQISERSARNYCAQGRVEGALLEGKTWKIPAAAKKPERKIRHSNERGYLRDTCLTAQDAMKAILDYFGIKYAS